MDAFLGRPLQVTPPLNSPEAGLLADLQGNIVKAHGCPLALHVFVNFQNADAARRCLRELVLEGLPFPLATAQEQFSKPRWLSGTGLMGERPFLSVVLSHRGYTKLLVDGLDVPRDLSFVAGMQARAPEWLGDDPGFREWDDHFKQLDANRQFVEVRTIHAMFLLAGHDEDRLRACAAMLADHAASAGIVELGREFGRQLCSKDKPVEHFGFVDNVSSTSFVERPGMQPPRHWDSLAPLGLVLERCRGGEHSFGSYVVFRKLKQDVGHFQDLARRLARRLCLRGPNAAERAAELIIGRRKDGGPLVGQRGADPNDFDFDGDRDGSICPIASHIRKMNPRGWASAADERSVDLKHERLRRIARRGITYGNPGDKEVGLLFICYQSSIERQFEHLQREWANDHTFPPGSARAGRDMLIGQGPTVPARLPSQCRGGGMSDKTIESCVVVKGGEYFFAPSISFFRNL